jgi:bifunctional DNA-binding transcriptional regulator/antitoxin component of YhaV-PrlF toxin-antitoxin module
MEFIIFAIWWKCLDIRNGYSSPTKTLMSEATLKVGKKGEIFTSSDIRKRAKIKEGGRVKASVVGNKLIIEAIPSVREILSREPGLRMTTKEFEKLSEEYQKEEGIYG